FVWCLPEVVFEETLRHYHNAIREIHRDLDVGISRLNKLINREVDKVHLVPNELEDDLRQFYLEYFNQNKNTRFISVPNEGLRNIFFKDLLNKKPFNEKGFGFRDQLVWESVVTILKEKIDNEVIFITNDISAFFNEEKILHSDLCEELNIQGIDRKRIRTFISLKEFLLGPIKDAIGSNQEIFDALKDNKWPLLSWETIYEKIEDFLTTRQLDLSLPLSNSSEAYIDVIEKIKITEIEQIDFINDSLLGIYFKCEISAEFTYYIDKSEYYANSEEFEIDIVDSDYNDYTMEASIQHDEMADCSIAFSISKKAIEEISIEFTSLDFDYYT
ncbi:PIN domain-containing protein, partial [Leptospira kmetyi]|uniref:PIN domain-containing protein n=1 Tax=Leptospira kmetyi TaxID=408139 RepID=UPI0010830FB2